MIIKVFMVTRMAARLFGLLVFFEVSIVGTEFLGISLRAVRGDQGC